MSEATAYYLVGASNICSACEKPYIDCICDQKRSLGFPAKPIPHKEIDEYKAGWNGKNTHAFPDMSGFRYDAETVINSPAWKHTPEHRLWLAVLNDAILCLQGRDKVARAEALEWFQRTDEGEFSFAWICQQFDRDPGYTRKQILTSTTRRCISS